MNNSFNYRLIKARVAETIIKELFQECGYLVYEYGMERTMPELMKSMKNKDGRIAENIRFAPDFVVQNAKTGSLNYLEVKYRRDGKFNFSNLKPGFPYKNAFFIIVSKNDIQWISYKLLKEGRYLSGNSRMQLENCKVFKLNPDTVMQYKKYAQDFFSNVE